jgi:predicted ATPase
LSEALAAVADEQPVLVLIDDAHWLDRESLLALGVCIRNLATSPVLFVLTALPQIRRAELDEVRAHIGREIAGAAVTVHPLALDDLRELARGAFARYDDVQLERLARRLLVDSAGIPLLAVELLGALAAGLDMQHVSHAWPEPFRTLNQTFPADLPDVLTAALRVNFHSLSADARSVLVAAAVLEGRSPAPLLSHVSGVAGDALVAALDELEWRRWLACEPRGYSFVARIRRDVIARDMVGSAERARMLAAAAQFTPS